MKKRNNVDKQRSLSFIWYKRQDYKLINYNLENIKRIDLLIKKAKNTLNNKNNVQFVDDVHTVFKRHIFNKRDGMFFINCAGYMAAFCLSFACFIPLATYAMGLFCALSLLGAICSLAMAKISFMDAKIPYSKLVEKINRAVPDFSQKKQTLKELLDAYLKFLRLYLPNSKRRNSLTVLRANSRDFLLKYSLINSFNLKNNKKYLPPLLQRRDTSINSNYKLKPINLN